MSSASKFLSLSNMKRRITRYFPAFVFAVFLVSGNFKSDPRLSWIPMDLTLLFALSTIAMMARSFMRNRFRLLSKHMVWVFILYFLFAIPFFYTYWSPYATDKMLKFYSFTLVAALAPFFLCRTKTDFRLVLHMLCFLSLILSFDAISTILIHGSQEIISQNASGTTGFGSNTIALGRAAGIAFLWIGILWLDGHMKAIVSIPLLAFVSIALISSGSRGPLLSAVAGLLLFVTFFYRKKAGNLARFLFVSAFISCVFIYTVAIAPQESTNRIESFLHGDLGNSEQMRIKAYTLSWEEIQDKPLGLGWGGFRTYINLWYGEIRQYPHNIFLEVLLEAGWVSGLYLLFLTAGAFWRIFLNEPSTERSALFTLLFFFLANAMVSGDINDNKLFFAFLGAALAIRGEIVEEMQGSPS